VILLLVVILGAAATIAAFRNAVPTLARVGAGAACAGVLGLGLMAIAPNLLVLYVAAIALAYGSTLLAGCLIVTRCGRSGTA
jgi:hypothetical protein